MGTCIAIKKKNQEIISIERPLSVVDSEPRPGKLSKETDKEDTPPAVKEESPVESAKQQQFEKSVKILENMKLPKK